MRYLTILAASLVALFMASHALANDPCVDALDAAHRMIANNEDVQNVEGLKAANDELMDRIFALMEIKMETGSTTADGKALVIATEIMSNDNKAFRLLNKRLLLLTVLVGRVADTCTGPQS